MEDNKISVCTAGVFCKIGGVNPCDTTSFPHNALSLFDVGQAVDLALLKEILDISF